MDLKEILSCNCSICSKRGSLLAFVGPEQFKLVSGEGDLKDYQFNKKIIHHYFCTNCGVSSFAKGVKEDGSVGYAVNVRCLDDVDLGSLKVVEFDGKSM